MPSSKQPKKPLKIWLITDNKPGHKNQLEGLLRALSRKHPINPSWIEIHSFFHTLISFFNVLKSKKEIDFCIGAGHKTHLFLILCKLFLHTKTIVLMKPSLPLCWFDLVIIPEHDGLLSAPNIFRTTGVINKIVHSSQHNKNTGLFLIGGPSKHFGWNNQEIIHQIQTIMQSQPSIHWTLTTSRRTPKSFVPQLQQAMCKLEIVPHTESTPEWLPEILAKTGQAWVSKDSVSMIYEALSSGTRVGLLSLPCLQKGRIQQGLERLLLNRQLVDFSQWVKNQHFPNTPLVLKEADRVAEFILQNHFHVQ
jgi:mitochondrial fission protein ELM1